jgi:putative peptide zinc metalloprotease protein
MGTAEQPFVVVKDPVDGRMFQLEAWEEDVLPLLDGTRDLEQLAADLAARRPSKAMDVQAMADYVESMRLTGLLERSEQESHLVMMDKLRTLRRRRIGKAEVVSVFQIQFKLIDPDRIMNRVLPWIRWWWSPAAVLGWLAIFVVVVGFLLYHWDLYWAGFFRLIDPTKNTLGDWLGLFALVFSVGIWHELGHGFTVKRFGGEVHDIGFMIFYFEPAFYCNVNESYLFPSAAHRIWTSLGGLYFELMLCSLALACWLATPAEWWIHGIALSLVFITGLGGLFNLNPLIKLDGYYVLMDWLDVPDLREHSFAFLGSWCKRTLLRLEVARTPISRWRRRVYLGYGAVAIVYTTLVLLFLYSMFRGWFLDWFGPAGYVVLLAVITYLFRAKIREAAAFMRHVWLDKRELLRDPRGRWITLGVLLAVALLAAVPRWPTRIDARFVVEPAHRSTVHAPADAIVRAVDVVEGQTVEAGARLALLDSFELRAAHRRASAERSSAERRAAEALRRGDATSGREWQDLAREAGSRESELEGRLDALELRTPTRGVVTTPDLANAVGRMLAEGEPFCAVDQLDAVELVITAAESDVDEIAVGTPVRLFAAAFPLRTLRAAVQAVAPIAETPTATEDQALDLVHPVQLVRLRVRTDNPGSLLRPGMSGRVQILGHRRSLLETLGRGIARWTARIVW